MRNHLQKRTNSFRGKQIVQVVFLIVCLSISSVSGYGQLKGLNFIDQGGTDSPGNPNGFEGMTYTSFNNAVAALQTYHVSGPVTFKVKKGAYNEQITIPPIGGTSFTSTVAFVGETVGIGVTLKYAPTDINFNWVVKLENASFIAFRRITIANESTAPEIGRVFVLDPSSNWIENVEISDCKLYGRNFLSPTEFSNTYSVLYEENSSSFRAKGLYVVRNHIYNGTTGIDLSMGSSLATANNFSDNTINNFNHQGISLNNQQFLYVIKNKLVGKSLANTTYAIYGSYLQKLCRFIGNQIYLESSNYNKGFYLTGGGGILDNPIQLYNNFISIKTGIDENLGIYIDGVKEVNIDFNSIHLFGNNNNASCLKVINPTLSEKIRIRNNIFYSRAANVCLYIEDNTNIETCDYNDIFCPNGPIGVIGTTYYQTLIEWKTPLPNFDANSISINPIFRNDSNLHVQSNLLKGKGIILSFPTTDIDGDLRNANLPDIGADEFIPFGQMFGNYMINSTLNNTDLTYRSFQDAADAAESRQVGGPVNFKVANGTYNESFIVRPIQGTDNTNRVTFESLVINNTMVTINSFPSNSNYVVRLENADYITFKNMTLKNISSGSSGKVFDLYGQNQGIQIFNNKLFGKNINSTDMEFAVIFHVGGPFMELYDLTIQSNEINNGSYGIYLNGDVTYRDMGTKIDDNTFLNYSYSGVLTNNQNALTVIRNKFSGNTGVDDQYGIYGDNLAPPTNISGNKINMNGKINSWGIYLANCSYNPDQYNLISNNFITQTSQPTSTTTGMMIIDVPRTDILNNTINIIGAAGSQALKVSASPIDIIKIQYNILINKGAGGYCINLSDPGFATTPNIQTCDYNSYWFGAGVRIGYHSAFSAFVDISLWRTNLGFDNNSIVYDPVFVDPLNLHLKCPSLALKKANASPVSYDIDGDVRGSLNYIGADEYRGAQINATSDTICSFLNQAAQNGYTDLHAISVEKTGFWTKLDNGWPGAFSLTNSSNTNLTGLDLNKDYRVLWTINEPQGFQTVDTIVVCTLTSIAGNDQTICSLTGQLSGNNLSAFGAKGKWSDHAAIVSLNYTSLNNATYTFSSSGYSSPFTWTVKKNQCSSSDIVTISNEQLTATIDASDLATGLPLLGGPHYTTCTAYAQLGLTAKDFNNNDVTGELDQINWTLVGGGGSITNPNASNVIVSNITNMTTIHWFIKRGGANGCIAEGNVYVHNKLPFANAGPDKPLCQDNIKLVANQPKTDENGHWSIDPYNSGYNIIDNIISPSINVTNLFPGSVTFTWTVTNGICTASDETTVTNNIGKSAVINKSITLPICTNSVEIIANDISGNWTSTNPQITFDNSLSSHTFVRNLQTGINMLKWKVAVGTCVSEDTYTIASNFVPHFAGNDQILCNANSTNLTAQNPSPGTGYWTASDSPTPVSPTNPLSAINGLFHGFNSYSWTVANNGCTWTEYVNINNIFVQAIVSIPTQICTTNVIIKANNPGVATGAWSYVGSGNPNIVYINEPTTEVVNLNPGIHTFKWTVNQSVCTANASANVEYTQLVATANSNVSIVCNNSTISLIGNPFPTGGTGRWFDELGNAPILNPNSPTAYATPNLSASNYQFKWEIIKGICKNSKTLILNNNTPSLASANANPISVCYNMSDLSATNPSIGTGKWVPLTSGASIVSPSSYITSTQTLALGPNKFRWTVDNQGCMSYQDVIVTKNAGVTAFAGNDKSVCSSTFTLQANQPIVGQGYWSGAVGGNVKITNSQLYNSQITGLQPEIAQVLRWTIAGTCSGELASDDVRIIYKQPSTASAYSNKTFTCLGSDVVLTAQSPTIGTGSWSTIKGNGTFNNPNGLVTGVSGLSLGENIFRWTVYYFGCTSSIDITIYNDMVTANAGPDKIVCKPEAALEATPILQGVGRWSSTGNLILFDKPESNNSNVKNLIKGANFLVWTVTKGNCSAMDEVKILNDQVITYAGSDQKICTDATVLDAKLPLTAEYGTWSGVGSIQFDNRQKNNTPIKSIPIGKNTLIWSVSNQNCSIKDTVVIINNSVKAEVAQQSQTVCSPEARISAKAPSQGIGQWSKDNTITSAIISNPIDLQTYTTGLSQGINRFIWRVVLEECISSTSTMVVNNQLFANAGQDQITCQDVTDLAAVKPVRGTGIWTTRQGSGYASQPGLINSPVVKLVNGQNIFVWTISDGQCVSSDEVLINNMKVTANAGQDQVLCESKTTMAADEPGYGFGKWTSNTSLTFLNSEYKNTTVSGLAQGANILKWTVSNSYCSTFDEVIITNNEVKADAGKDNNGCSATAILQAVAPVVGTGKWTAIGNAKIDLPDNYLITVSNLTYGENQFVWTVTNQNCSAYDVAIAGNWGLKADAGADFEVCSSDSYLPAVMPLDGVYRNWLSDPVVVVADRSNPKSYIMSLKPGENKFVWNIYNNYCSSSDEVIIRNNAVSAFAGDDKILCTDSVKLSAIIPIQGQGKWSVKNGSGTFDNELLNNAFVRKLGFGQNRFVWTVSLGKCLASDEVIITNNKVKAELLSAENQTICTNAGNLNAKTPSSGTGSWSSSQKNKITNPNSPVTPVTNLVQGMNNFYWRVINEQCVDELKIILNNKSVYANAGQDQIICTDSTFMKAIQSGSPGYWEKISGYADFADLLSPISKIKNVRQGENRFRWNVINDKCYASDEVVITNRTVSVTADANLTVCKADASLKAIVKGSGSGNWSIVYGGGTPSISTQTNTAVTNLSRGNNLFVYTYSNESCSAFDDIMISNNSFIINAGEDLTLCSNTTLLNGQDFYPQTGTWEVVSGAAKFVNPKDGKTKVEQLGYGSNKLRWTMEYRGCKNSDEVIINNAGLNPTMISKILNGNTNTVEFTANVSGQYDKLLWDFADGRSSEIKNPVHVFQLPKEYNVCLTAKNSKFGCVEMVCSKVNLNFATLTADYSFTVDKLTLAVKFTDKSLSNTTITKWNWAFGDLGTSLEQNPTFKFTKEGNYFVCLTIENQAGFKTYICKTIEVKKQNCNLVADFYMVKDEATKKIQLFDISQGNANQWNWTFGDGNTSDQRNPVYTYNEVKEYEIILKIQENSTGCFSEKSRTVRFGEIICKAEFNAIINPNSTSVKFENFSKAATGTGIKTYYHWVFGDGGESSETAPTHAYLKDGFYDVILVLKNEGSVNCEDYIMKKIMVGNPGCAADFTYLPVSGTEVKFINQSVGQSEIYNWYFGDGSSSTAKDVTHVFPKAGIYTVKLTIGNQTSNCYSEKEKLIIVDQINIDCEAEFVYQTDPVNMIGKFYNASIGSNLSFTWSFGDEDYSYTKDAEHKYDANKVYNVCLTAYNQFTQKTTCKNVPLLQAAQTEPTLIPDFGYLLVPGTNKVVFFDKSTGNTKKWDWEFGDSKLGSGNRLEHLYDKPNYYLVHLKVTDTKNISKDIFKLVNVNMGDGWFVDFGFTVPSNNTKKGGYPVNYISATWGTPAKAVWNFGDGTKDSTSLNPIYGYKSAGTYHVCFEASDPVTGQSGKVCKDVTISTTGIWLSENLQASLINFPNPFNDVTHIIYSLPKATTVTLAVFDILGNKVVTLVDEQKSAGSYSTTLSKQKLEIGVYFLQFETPQGKMVNKIIITE